MRSFAMGEFARHWRAVSGCTIGTSIGVVSLYIHSSGAFAVPLMREEGYSRVQLSGATFLLTIMIAISAPFGARLIGRYGAWRVIAFSMAGEALGFALLALLPAYYLFYLVAVALLAFWGAGTTPPGFAQIVAARFDSGRGAALGVMTGGLGLMAILMPMLSSLAVAGMGWRSAFGAMAVMVLLLGSASLLLIARDPAADPIASVASSESPAHAAQRDVPLWRLALAFGLPALGCGGYLLHLIDMLTGRGIAPLAAAGMQSLMGLAILLGRVGSGLLVDRFPAQIIVALLFALSALGCVLLASAGLPFWSLACFAIGLTVGAEMDMMAFFLSRYCGQERFVRLYAFAYAGLVLVGGASPLLLAGVVEVTGYGNALLLSATLAMAGAVIAFTLPDPKAR